MRDHVLMSQEVPAGPTVLVLTALQVEMTAVMAHMSSTTPEPVGPVVCEVGHFEASNGLPWRVAAADGARRRCLTALLGPPDNPHVPDAQTVEILAPLLSAGVVDEREAARVRSSFDLAPYELLLAHGMTMDMLVPSIVEDLGSGEFGRQNAAARFLYRLPASQSEQPLGGTLDISLGEKLVRAASGEPYSFGAAEAMSLSYLSTWPRSRLAGGIWAALTSSGGRRLDLPDENHLAKLIAAAAGAGQLSDVLDRVRSLLDDSLKRVPDDMAAAVSDELMNLARRYAGGDQRALDSFAAWILERK